MNEHAGTRGAEGNGDATLSFERHSYLQPCVQALSEVLRSVNIMLPPFICTHTSSCVTCVREAHFKGTIDPIELILGQNIYFMMTQLLSITRLFCK